jgi:hypothetical protein
MLVAAEFLAIVLVRHYSSAFQVGSPRLTSIACDFDPLCSMEDRTAGVDAECSRSIQGDCVPSQFSKPYLMYSATDATSATVDFAKGNVEDGVVNSLPNRGTSRSPVCSPSLLRGCNWTPIGQRSCSLTEWTIRTPQRQLYSKPLVCSTEEAKETNPVHYDNKVHI